MITVMMMLVMLSMTTVMTSFIASLYKILVNTPFRVRFWPIRHLG